MCTLFTSFHPDLYLYQLNNMQPNCNDVKEADLKVIP